MKEYFTPSVTGQENGGFIVPALGVVGLSKAAAFAVGAAIGLAGDKSVSSDFPVGLEPCIDYN